MAAPGSSVRLTVVAGLLAVALGVAIAFAVAARLRPRAVPPTDPSSTTREEPASRPGVQPMVRAPGASTEGIIAADRGRARDPRRIILGGPDGPPLAAAIVANGGLHTRPESLLGQAGLSVEVRPMRGVEERLAAFSAGHLDLLVLPAERVAALPKSLCDEVVTIAVVALGGAEAALVALPRVRTLDQLADERIAVPRSAGLPALAQALLGRTRSGSDAARRSRALLFVRSPAQAIDAYRRGEVSSALLPAPHWETALQTSPPRGSTVPKPRLLLPASAVGPLLPLVLIARRAAVQARHGELATLVGKVLEAGRRLTDDRKGVARLLGRALELAPDEALLVAERAHPASLGDQALILGPGGLFEELTRLGRESLADDSPEAGSEPPPPLRTELLAPHAPLGVEAVPGRAEAGPALPMGDELSSTLRSAPPLAKGSAPTLPLVSRSVQLRFELGPDGVRDRLADVETSELGQLRDLVRVFDGCPLRLIAFADRELSSAPLGRRRLRTVAARLARLQPQLLQRLDVDVVEAGRLPPLPPEEARALGRFELRVLPPVR